MGVDLMGPAPAAGEVDPLAPEHVAPLVVYLASPAAEAITGEAFVVHGGVAAVMEPPRIPSGFRFDSAGGMLTPEAGAEALALSSATSGFSAGGTVSPPCDRISVT